MFMMVPVLMCLSTFTKNKLMYTHTHTHTVASKVLQIRMKKYWHVINIDFCNVLRHLHVLMHLNWEFLLIYCNPI